jgi:integrase
MKSRDGKSTHYKTKYGNWLVRFFSEDGEVRNKNCKTKTERDALERAIKRREDLDYWFPVESGNVARCDVGTFKALAEKWLDHSLKVREISESCMMNYRCHLKHHILPVIGDRFLKDLDLKSIEEVASILKEKRPQTRSYVAVRQKRMEEEFYEDDDFLSGAYRREILTVACMVTKFGFERGLVAVNPFREFKLPECPEQPYDYWRLDEEDAFLKWLEDGGYVCKEVTRPYSAKQGQPEKFLKRFKTRNVEELYDTVLFALRSGLRKGEIGALTARDVNFAKNYVVVRRSYSEKEKRVKTTTKGKTFRIIEMNEDMRNILKKRIDRANLDTDLLFNTKTWAIKHFSKYCAKAGVREIHFHSLRHTCLTNLANGYGMDSPLPLPQVQKIAGHKDVGTTMRYVHVDGIENTGSRQWSREMRRNLQEAKSSPVPAPVPVQFPASEQVPQPAPIRLLKLVNSPAN